MLNRICPKTILKMEDAERKEYLSNKVQRSFFIRQIKKFNPSVEYSELMYRPKKYLIDIYLDLLEKHNEFLKSKNKG